MTLIYQLAALFLMLNIVAGMVRVLRGPTTADRLLAVQLFGTTGTAILILFSLQTGNKAFQDLALIFALLAGILGVTFTRYGQAWYKQTPTELQSDAEARGGVTEFLEEN
jgi:multicomponent Na+:H+ antiporter subunit F